MILAAFYGLRRGEAVGLKDIQKWLGHSDISTTVDIRYPHKKPMSPRSEPYHNISLNYFVISSNV